MYRTRFAGVFLFFAALILLGSVGYVLVEGEDLGDSVYMTVITLTAVGYNEVFPLSPAGRVLTSFILFGGCLLYTSPSPRDRTRSRMPSSA